MSNKTTSHTPSTVLPPPARVILSLLVPFVGGLTAAVLVGGPAPGAGGAQVAAPFLGGAGLVSWFMGLRWYGLPGLGLRGKRPLFAGIGFAVMGWVVVLLARILTVGSADFTEGGLGRIFIYLLLFEAFAVHLWAFGIVFRAVADWLGGLTAAFSSGLIFAFIVVTTFDESFVAGDESTFFGLLFFAAWGFFYGLIRLRTGSLLGLVPVQAMQTLTTWHLLLPQPNADLRLFYSLSALLFLILIWRLWPTRESDYRV